MKQALDFDEEYVVYICEPSLCGFSPSLDSPEPWVNSSWYCLFGKDSGKILDTRGLKGAEKQRLFSYITLYEILTSDSVFTS